MIIVAGDLASVQCDYCFRRIIADTAKTAARVAKDAGWLTINDTTDGQVYHCCPECQAEWAYPEPPGH